MKELFSNFALVDVGSSKIALVVPQDGAGVTERHLAPRCCLVEHVVMENLAADAEIARAEAFRRLRLRAEAMLGMRLRKIFLLATEPSLELVSPSHEKHYLQTSQQTSQQTLQQNLPKNLQQKKNPAEPPSDNEEMIVINAVATDRNKRPVSFYAMRKRRWQFYARIASYAGVSIAGFVFPAIALGQSLLVYRSALASAAERTKIATQASSIADEKSFVILDIGARTAGVAIFKDGVPCACQSWQFGAASLTAAIAKSFSLTHERAAALQRGLALSGSFLNDMLDPSSSAADPALSERRFPRLDAFAKKTKQKSDSTSPLDVTKLAAAQQGALRLVVSQYGSFFSEVSRFLERCAPHDARDAPVYTAGGGSVLAGIHVLASHLLARGVFPYPCLVANVSTRDRGNDRGNDVSNDVGNKIAAASALASLSVLARGGLVRHSPPVLSSKLPRSRRLKIFSSRESSISESSRDSFPSPTEDTSHA